MSLLNWWKCNEILWCVICSWYVGGWSALWPTHFTPSEKAWDTHWIGDWVCPRIGLDIVEKRKVSILSGLLTQTPFSILLPVYTDLKQKLIINLSIVEDAHSLCMYFLALALVMSPALCFALCVNLCIFLTIFFIQHIGYCNSSVPEINPEVSPYCIPMM
jgi:hypothetical protein